jgi:chorismate dehydratase
MILPLIDQKRERFASETVRIGSVPYLNARPLIYGLEKEVHLSHPSTLAQELREGLVDVALVPVAECLEYPAYNLVDGIGITCRGPVHSVILEHHVTLRKIKTVSLGSVSKTSAQLARVLLESFLNLKVEYVPETTKADANLLIGDAAIARRAAHPDGRFWDLGQSWLEATGLPFVFAVWAMRPDEKNRGTADLLRTTAIAGLAARREIAQTPEEYTYLTKHIRYQIGTEEKAGLLKFAQLLAEIGAIKQVPKLNWT